MTQKTIVLLGALVVCAMVVYPPWMWHSGSNVYKGRGYDFIFNDEMGDRFQLKSHIDTSRLSFQILAVILLTTSLAVFCSDGRDEPRRIATEQPPLRQQSAEPGEVRA